MSQTEQTRKYRDEEWLRQKYVEEGLSDYEIGDLCDVHNTTILKWRHKYGIESTTPHENFEPEQLREWYHKEGLTLREIGEKVGKSEFAIRYHFKKHGIERRSPNKHKLGPWQNKDVMEELYIDQNLTMREVAEELGIHHSTARKWIHRHDIPVRQTNGLGLEIDAIETRPDVTDAERQTLRDEVETVLVSPNTNNHPKTFHIKKRDGVSLCGFEPRTGDYLEKDLEMYPEGWGEWCKNCVAEWRQR